MEPGGGGDIVAHFVPLESENPGRWDQPDSGAPVRLHVQPGNDPLGQPAAALEAVVDAMQSWTAVPEARITVEPGHTDYDYTGTFGQSPARKYTGVPVGRPVRR